jgi:DNA-binding transcriptional ArsR family regulator
MEKFCNEAYFRFFNALANRTNLAIIDLLADGSRSISEIADFLDVEPSTVSKNLEQLQGCALIHSGTPQDVKLCTLNREIVVPLGELLAFHAAKHCPGLRECIPEAKLKEYLKKEAAKETYIEH